MSVHADVQMYEGMWNVRMCEVWSMWCMGVECGVSGMRLFFDLESELGSFCRIIIVMSDRKARKTEVTQSRFEQTECLFANVQWRRLKKIHQSIGFLALFLALLSGEVHSHTTSKVMAHRRHHRGRQYPRRVMISLTNVARSPTRKRRRRRWNISERLFFYVAAAYPGSL